MGTIDAREAYKALREYGSDADANKQFYRSQLAGETVDLVHPSSTARLEDGTIVRRIVTLRADQLEHYINNGFDFPPALDPDKIVVEEGPIPNMGGGSNKLVETPELPGAAGRMAALKEGAVLGKAPLGGPIHLSEAIGPNPSDEEFERAKEANAASTKAIEQFQKERKRAGAKGEGHFLGDGHDHKDDEFDDFIVGEDGDPVDRNPEHAIAAGSEAEAKNPQELGKQLHPISTTPLPEDTGPSNQLPENREFVKPEEPPAPVDKPGSKKN